MVERSKKEAEEDKEEDGVLTCGSRIVRAMVTRVTLIWTRWKLPRLRQQRRRLCRGWEGEGDKVGPLVKAPLSPPLMTTTTAAPAARVIGS